MGSDAKEPMRRSHRNETRVISDDTRVITDGTSRNPTTGLEVPDPTAIQPVAGLSRYAAPPGPPKFLVAQSVYAKGRDGSVFGPVSFSAERGALVVIAGGAGTGRTALLLTLAGRYRQRSGTVAVAADERPRRIRRRVALACAPPAVVVDANHKVSAVLTESALVGGIEVAAVRGHCHDLGLRLDTDLAFGQLSKVDQTLLVLASAWAQGAPAIAIDDLDCGVDDSGAVRLWEAARFVADDNRLVLSAAVRASAATDLVIRPRPIKPGNSTRVTAREASP